MRTKNTIYLFCFLFFNLFSLVVVSQNAEEIDKIRAQYQDAKAIFLTKSEEYKIFIENNSVKGTCNTHEQILINNESGINFQTRSVPSSHFVEVSKIKAFIQIPNGKKYIRKDVDKIEQKDNTDRSVFYDDSKLYSFTYPSAQVGAILNLDYVSTYKEPRFLGSYFWANYIPYVNDELKISVQKGINIKYKLFNTENFDLEFTKEEKKDEVVYTWRSKDKRPIPLYSDAPDFRYYEPHIIFYVTDYTVNGKKDTLLGTPKELYKWYVDIQKNVNKTEDAHLKKVTDSLVVGVTDEWEKVKKIFYWVQDNISYVAFEDGLGGFVPRDAGIVCSRKYGDCKDMASIIHEMLTMAGVKSYLTWIGSRDIPYTYVDVPTPASDNHMITSYLDKNNKWIFLDGTGKKASIDMYTSFIQGKQALISISADSFQLATVPVKDTSVNQTIDSITIDIKDNVISGKGTAILTGYDGLDYFYRTEYKNKDELQEFFKNYFSKGSNKVNFKDVVMKTPERAPVTITYNFDLPDYAKYNQNEMYINLNMDKGLILEKIVADRKVPVSMKHKTQKRLITILNIPEGYKVDFVPPNVKVGNDLEGFTSTYEIKNNQIIHISDIYINTLILQPADFEKYNSVITAQVRAFNQAVSFIKK
jgi:hypothetical protein